MGDAVGLWTDWFHDHLRALLSKSRTPCALGFLEKSTSAGNMDRLKCLFPDTSALGFADSALL